MAYRKRSQELDHPNFSADDVTWWKHRWPAEPWASMLEKSGMTIHMIALWFGGKSGTDFIKDENGVTKIKVKSGFHRNFILENFFNCLKNAFPNGFRIEYPGSDQRI